MGLGFPTQRAGLLYWADTLGPGSILPTVLAMETLGQRMQPTSSLLEMAASVAQFYPNGSRNGSLPP